MSTMDSYGVVNEGVVQINNGNNNSGPHSSQPSGGLIPDMHLAFTTEDGAAVYKPVMPPNSPLSSSAGVGDGSALPRRKRGRPKKYPYEGDMSSLPPQPPEASAAHRASGLASPPPTAKKSRGRPLGSGRKQQPLGIVGLPGRELTAHVITVTAGEDVSSKIMSFSQYGSRGLCILSANGAISNVTLRHPATSGGTVTYEGRFEILSLSGSYMLLEDGGQRSRTGGLSVTLAGPDGHVLGGGVAGILTAAAPVQVIVGCFIEGEGELNSPIQANPLAPPPKLLPGASSGGTLSESSGGPGSPINQSTGACNNSNPQALSGFSWQ
ncbi:AT-hook motif nuclear-localized protein 10-like [Actinidia eriantha]|uniref:AT-hook motif nuclear-localized protein 10-like n=1 Tax=Actinidia eriantha TaxID=165200 RepID=UPI00258F557B|nr:AT-hook motif nuclear-localized protein 10-like [Actinidia eriantha]XP_057492334.1 AT-hook motif nuclear-localized protein 10-like [Actinidia eriantha]